MKQGSPGSATRVSRRLACFAGFWLAALAFALFASAPRAAADIYWTDLHAGTIGRASLNGKNVRRGFIKDPVSPFGIAANSRHVFWTDTNRDTISRAGLNGGRVIRDFVRMPGFWTPSPFAVEVSGGRLFWTSGSTYIGRAWIDGRRAHPRYLETGSDIPNSVAVNRRRIFWSASERQRPDTIGRALRNGKKALRSFINTRNTGPSGVGLGAGFIFWSNANTNSISRARLDGTGVRRHFIRTGRNGVVSDVDVAGGYVYWTDYIRGTIGRARLDGGGVRRNFIRASGNRGGLRGLAVVPARPHPPDVGLG